MRNRRWVMQHGLTLGLAAATAPLWSSIVGRRAFAQGSTSSYKAVVVITLVGGNDGNNLLIPLGSAEYAEYSALRSSLAIPVSSIIPLPNALGAPAFGLHPALKNVAALYTQKRAAIVANIGPSSQPATKIQLAANPSLYPQGLLNHTIGIAQWESATAVALPKTGWGGRIADLISSESGSLPPVLNTSFNSIFASGNLVQAVAVQSGGPFPALPPGINQCILKIAQHDSSAANRLLAQTAQFRKAAMQEQAVLNLAMTYSTVKESFTNSQLGMSLKTIAQLLAGRSQIGAQRQLFYAQQPGFDTHANQLPAQDQLLSDLDLNLASFIAVLEDLGLGDDVLICTHSDFSRTMTGNDSLGTDHAWGSHQIVLGGGITGGRIIGRYPTLELGGADDTGGQGIWIPTLSVTQMTAAIGAWLGLNSGQLAQVFPDLSNFPSGAIQL